MNNDEKIRRLELALLERERKIRALEEALQMRAHRCPFCGTMVVPGA